jgi:diguanylate cyclase (GGDEF)-like protein
MSHSTTEHPTLSLAPGRGLTPRSATAEVARQVQRVLSHEHTLLRLLREREDLELGHLVSLAARLFDVPLAFIALVDEQQLWVLHTTLDIPRSVALEGTFCEEVFSRDELCVVHDALESPRFRDHVAVAQHGVRFYAGAPLRLHSGAPVGTLGLMAYEPRELTEERREWLALLAEQANCALRQSAELIVMRRQLQEEAFFDALTHLPKQALAREQLQEALRALEGSGRALMVLRLDLNQFTSVNEVLGRQTGDQILREVARRLRAALPASATVARWQGDEFLVVTHATAEPEVTASLAQRLLRAITEAPFVCGDTTHYLTASGGASVYPGDGGDADTLLDRASMALREARSSADNHLQFYSQLRNRDLHDQLFLWNELHAALQRGEFWMAYQPKVDLGTGAICGAEALIRWNHPRHGFISPARFIPVAEETGLIGELGLWTLRRTCAQLRQWLDEGLSPVPVAVNIANAQLQAPGFAQQVLALLDEFQLDSHLLELELTERTLVADTQNAAAVIAELNQRGVTCSIDDFGTGYSSLSYLAGLPLHALKVDRSFVSRIGQDERAAGIVEAIIAMSHSLGLQVIAEGVETQQELDFLRRCRCDAFQGYLFCKPVPSDDFGQRLRRGDHLQS